MNRASSSQAPDRSAETHKGSQFARLIERLERIGNDPNKSYLDGYDLEDEFLDDEDDNAVSFVSFLFRFFVHDRMICHYQVVGEQETAYGGFFVHDGVVESKRKY